MARRPRRRADRGCDFHMVDGSQVPIHPACAAGWHLDPIGGRFNGSNDAISGDDDLCRGSFQFHQRHYHTVWPFGQMEWMVGCRPVDGNASSGAGADRMARSTWGSFWRHPTQIRRRCRAVILPVCSAAGAVSTGMFSNPDRQGWLGCLSPDGGALMVAISAASVDWATLPSEFGGAVDRTGRFQPVVTVLRYSADVIMRRILHPPGSPTTLEFHPRWLLAQPESSPMFRCSHRARRGCSPFWLFTRQPSRMGQRGQSYRQQIGSCMESRMKVLSGALPGSNWVYVGGMLKTR